MYLQPQDKSVISQTKESKFVKREPKHRINVAEQADRSEWQHINQ